jgi:hypothetical protein
MYDAYDKLSNKANEKDEDFYLQRELMNIFGIGKKVKDAITPHHQVERVINKLFEKPVDQSEVEDIIKGIEEHIKIVEGFIEVDKGLDKATIAELQTRLKSLKNNSAGGGSRKKRNSNRNNRKMYKKRTKHRRKIRN